MRNMLRSFRADEDGAVTVDWVVLTAAIVGLAIAVIGTIAVGAKDQSTSLGNWLGAQSVATY